MTMTITIILTIYATNKPIVVLLFFSKTKLQTVHDQSDQGDGFGDAFADACSNLKVTIVAGTMVWSQGYTKN